MRLALLASLACLLAASPAFGAQPARLADQASYRAKVACENFLADGNQARMSFDYKSQLELCVRNAASDPGFVAAWFRRGETKRDAERVCAYALQDAQRKIDEFVSGGSPPNGYAGKPQVGYCMSQEYPGSPQ
jgi:hypothetical protein